MLPFPDDRLTVADPTTATGRRVRLPAAAMPVSRAGVAIAVGEYDRNDGFSPASSVVVHVPGLDGSRAWRRTGAAGIGDIPASLSRAQPIALIDERTGAREPIFSELDPTAFTADTTDVVIHAAANLEEGHSYVVALRDLRDAYGRELAAPRWFQRLRDRRRLPAAERSQRARYARIFAALTRAHIARAGLYEAWDFTVGSTASLTGRLLAIRDDAFAQLGDGDLGDGTVQGRAPAFTLEASTQLSPQLRSVQGTLAVPCYLLVCGASATSGFSYASAAPDALPAQLPGNVASVPFECVIPNSATAAHPARLAIYGHGFLGSRVEVQAPWVQELAVQHDIVFCAADWWGLAAGDLLTLIEALRNVNGLETIVDRIQQGVLDALLLGRLMRSSQGLSASAQFREAGRPVIDESGLYYYGNSVGGILGGVLTALSPDLRRAVLGVSGADFFTMLVPRGDVFARFGRFVTRNYRDHSLHPLVLDLLQQLWDRADPAAYATVMTARPLPDTPAHEVLMQIAYGDFQVSMYAAALEARAIGARAYEPALDAAGGRLGDRHLLFDVPPIPRFPFAGSAIEMWDSGAGHTQPPPQQGLAPTPGPANIDPHEDPRYTPAAQQQASAFMQPGGELIDVCAGTPCHSYDYTP